MLHTLHALFFSCITDLSETDYQAVDLTTSRKFSPASPPLSTNNSESIDPTDGPSVHSKSESNMAPSLHEKRLVPASRATFGVTRHCSNFSIEHILSSSFRSPTYELLAVGNRHIPSVFSKSKIEHLSERRLHRIIRQRKRCWCVPPAQPCLPSRQPQGILLRYVMEFYNDVTHRSNQIEKGDTFRPVDALEQLADLACKLDARQQRSLLNETSLSANDYDALLRQCRTLKKHVRRQYQQRKALKRLAHYTGLTVRKRLLQSTLSLINALQTKKNALFPKSTLTHCPTLPSDIVKPEPNRRAKESICHYLHPGQITADLDVLVPNNGLLYEATLQPVSEHDDLLLVRLHHERQTYLIPIHDLCRVACPKIVPQDFTALSNGLRVCAFWSTSLRGLHPATIDQIPSNVNDSTTVALLFDDGDTGLIKLNEIRLLPDGYNATGECTERDASRGAVICFS